MRPLFFRQMSHELLSNSQGNLRRHCRDLQLPHPRPLEGDRLHQVSLPGTDHLAGYVCKCLLIHFQLPGVHRLPCQEPPRRRCSEAGGPGLLASQLECEVEGTRFSLNVFLKTWSSSARDCESGINPGHSNLLRCILQYHIMLLICPDGASMEKEMKSYGLCSLKGGRWGICF